MNINIREQALPGIGQRFEIELEPGRRLVVIATPDGGRSIGLSEDAADNIPMIGLNPDQAVMVGALLLGARFSIDVSEDARVDGDTVIIDTVTVPEGAPSIGRRPSTVLGPLGQDTTVLGVIKDDVEGIIEDLSDVALAAGDQVALATRKDQLANITRLFTG